MHDAALDAVLRADPEGSYAVMDATTRARYRDVCRTLAGWSAVTSTDVASEAVRLAREPGRRTARARHVGCYLVAEGRPELEASLGCRIPLRSRCARSAREHAQGLYVGAILILAVLVWLAAQLLLSSLGAPTGLRVGGGLLLVIIGLNLGAGLVDCVVTGLTRSSQRLPRLDPAATDASGERSTIVVMPVLLGAVDDVAAPLRDMAMNYMNSADAGLDFALLTDFADADQPELPSDRPMLTALARGIDELNRRYGGGERRFHHFHRARRWNPSEGCWMGWERKRGKLHEFNRLLAGARDTSYVAGDALPDGLRDVRYVITLDADNLLPPGNARALIATLHHPLNRPQLDARDGRVVAGYGVLQPRLAFTPRSPQNLLELLFLGPSVVNLQAMRETVPLVSQDLFGVGGYMGKGIHDAKAFERVGDWLPDNLMLSHDRLEGMCVRIGYVSDVVAFEGHPFDVASWLRRAHRWARGDTQSLPYVLPRVPTKDGSRRNPLQLIDRWTLLRFVLEHLHLPATLALLIAGWSTLQQGLALWTLACLLVAQHLFVSIPLGAALRALASRPPRSEVLRAIRGAVVSSVGGVLLGALLWAEYSVVMVDAFVRSSYRLLVSRRLLLQWTVQAVIERQRRSMWQLLRRLWAGPALAVAVAILLLVRAPAALLVALPLLLLWCVTPVAAFLAQSRTVPARLALSARQQRELRCLARRSWALYQRLRDESPTGLPCEQIAADSGETSARTTSTELSFMLLAGLGAHDLGYWGTSHLALWAEQTLDQLSRLERHRGHLYAAYSFPDLRPLAPRTISAEQSGWLTAALQVLEQGLSSAERSLVPAPALAAGLADTAAVLRDEVDAALRARPAPAGERLRDGLDRLCAALDDAIDLQQAAAVTVRALAALDRDRKAWQREGVHGSSAVDDGPAFWWARLREQSVLVHEEIERRAGRAAEETCARLAAAAARARQLREQLDFAFLHDAHRDLLHTGFQVDAGALDPGRHERLDAGARLAGFLAMARGDIPTGHWEALARPDGALDPTAPRLPLEEHLLPTLLMRSPGGSRLRTLASREIASHIALAARHRIPWGIDGSSEDHPARPLAVAPHLSLLSLRFHPRGALENLERLAADGAVGTCGLFESILVRPDAGGERMAVRRVHRPSLQGAAIAAVVNAIADDLMVRRFHADEQVGRLSFLLHEASPAP